MSDTTKRRPRRSKRRSRRRPRPLRTALVLAGAVTLSAAVISTVLWAWFREVPVGGVPLAGLSSPALPQLRVPEPPVAGTSATAVATGSTSAAASPGGTQFTTVSAGNLQAPPPAPVPSGAQDLRVAVAAPAQPSAAPGDWRDTRGRPGQAQPGSVSVGEAELGMRLYPGAAVNAAEATLVQDPNAGQAAATSLTSADAFTKVAAFYRAQLAQARTAQVEIQEEPAAPGQLMMRAVDKQTGANRTVLIVQTGAQVNVTLSRWQPPVAVQPGNGG